ncbi:MAG TPA: hypothetical protein VG938_05160 [Verrucomicrobiae bacterium]|jgi:hypothetical protein|nr:hypothetical protein [Verrucomicrobiae bacterium]
MWFENEILKPLHTALLSAKIVKTAAGTLAAIRAPDGTNNIWFPSNAIKEIRNRIWRCCKDWFPPNLPAESDIHIWHDIIWPDCEKLTLERIAEWIEDCGTIAEVSAK